MYGFRHARHWGVSLLAAVLTLTILSFSAPACSENNPDAVPSENSTILKTYHSPYAPEVSRWPVRMPVTSTDASKDPQVSSVSGFVYPWLTDLELAKIQEFQVAMEEGEMGYAGASIVNPVSVGSQDVAVFSLAPDDFCGESFYVFLPGSRSMSDGQLAALLAAFQELGIAFDPDSLNDRNCCRHPNVLETRTLTAEESRRSEAIKDRIRRGQLKREDIPAEAHVLSVAKTVQVNGEPGKKPFFFYPYRSLTDDELALFALEEETEWDTDPEILKTDALQAAGDLIRLPENVNAYDPCSNRILLHPQQEDFYQTDNQTVYKYTSQFSFEGQNELQEHFHCNMDIFHMQKSGAVPEASAIHLWYSYDPDLSDRDHPESHEAEWLAAVQNWSEQTLRLPADILRSGWTVANRSDYYGTEMVQLRLVTEKWEICVWVYQDTAKVSDCLIYNREWYDDSYKGFRL